MKKEELKDFCKSIGIDCVGIAGVGPYYDLEKIIKQKDNLEYQIWKNYKIGD
mgnify:FL=1